MLVETLLTLKAHLEDPTRGLGAKLATTPRESGDALPATPTILEETSSIELALNRPPAALPALGLSIDGLEDEDARRVLPLRDASVAVLARLWSKSPVTNTGLRQAYYVVRALERSLDAWPTVALARNGVEVYACTAREYAPKVTVLEDSWILTGCRLVLQVRDTLA